MQTFKTPGLRQILLIYLMAVVPVVPCVSAEKDSATKSPTAQTKSSREQLSIGYSLLYPEANGIPKLKWLLVLKEKSEAMGKTTKELVSFYEHLAETMEKLSQQYPAMKIDVEPMSSIESSTRKAIGTDLAKDIAPLTGNAGIAFERKALLMFYNSLDEQRHLTGEMAKLETDPGLNRFLTQTQSQLQDHYTKVGALLERRYFVH